MGVFSKIYWNRAMFVFYKINIIIFCELSCFRYCSRCKEHRTIAKKLDIWKLPPVFVVHLKRFLHVNNRWIKSNKLVRFPVKTFDPSSYLAQKQHKQSEFPHTATASSTLHNRNCSTDLTNTTSDSGFSSVSSAQDMNIIGPEVSGVPSSTTNLQSTSSLCERAEHQASDCPPYDLEEEGGEDDDKESVISISTITLERSTCGRPNMHPFEPRSPSPPPPKTTTNATTTTTSTNATTNATELRSPIPETAVDDSGCMYSLYAISCHSGLMNGGHYTTFARNPNGKWYCYNDSSCKEVSLEVIERESPYMLFYERCDVKCGDKYLPDVSQMETVNVNTGEDEEFEKEVRKYCTIM